ncbi:YegP family protein [Halovivax asiaticus]|uniref:YegP family protein n=1 Tax=Halovivax asiaticus TaxID=332953 RepID=UPI000677EB1C|nr:YegP family protein [Halovivax asiaticus]
MSSIRNFSDKLLRLYEHYVGEPESVKDAYGYWLFVAGFILGGIAVILYIVNFGATEPHSDAEFLINRVVGIVGSIGAILGLFGLVLMLPVRKRAVQASAVGVVIALIGTATFGIAYPDHWRKLGDGPDYTIQVLGLYAVGLGIIAGVTALVPVITGRKGKYVSEEGATDDPPVLTGDAMEGAQFAVFRDENDDWSWHVLHLEALAASQESALTRPDAQADIEEVKSQIGSAGLMELTTSAFRLYETRDGQWEWTLVRDDGSVVARCGDPFETRDGAEESVSFLKDRGPVAGVIEIDDAAFNYYESRDRWHWQLLDGDREPLAVSPTGYTSKADAKAGSSAFVDHFEDARLLAMEHVAIELIDESGGWYWRFVGTDDEEIGRSERAYETRRDAEEAIEALLESFDEMAVTVSGEPTYELYSSGEEWRWRLVGYDEQIVARNPNSAERYDEMERTTDLFANNVEDADVFEIDGALYERYKTDGHWRWRLVDEDRNVVAASTEPHDSAEDAADAIERMQNQASEAELIEFENSAFQVYEADTGEWRWRLIDEDGNVLADSGAEHGSKSEAAEAMMTLKEQAPDAELLEIETAAFELFVDDGEWGWRLIDDGGKLIAEDPNSHPNRQAAKQAMDQLVENIDTESQTMEHAAFQTYVDEDEWFWRFVMPDGTVVAESEESAPTQDEIVEGIDRIRDVASTADRSQIDELFVQLAGSGSWHWRLLDRDREIIATSQVTYDSRQAVETAIDELVAKAPDAPIFHVETALIRLTNGDGWTWDLVDQDRDVLATAGTTVDDESEAMDVVDEIRRLAPAAGQVDFDVASYEFISDEEGWSWRLIDEDGQVVAKCIESFETMDGAETSVEQIRDVIPKASILEIDGVSFELHYDDDGWIWQLVDEHGEPMSESTKTYESRTEARDAMTNVKVHAPDGWIEFTE